MLKAFKIKVGWLIMILLLVFQLTPGLVHALANDDIQAIYGGWPQYVKHKFCDGSQTNPVGVAGTQNLSYGGTAYFSQDGQAHPLVIFAPGRDQDSKDGDFYARYLKAIAAQGFTVVGANFSNNHSYEAINGEVQEIRSLLDHVQGDKDLITRIDPTKGIALVGHSDGGIVALRTTYPPGKDARFTAVLSADGAIGTDSVAGSGPPLLVMHGTNDTFEPIASSESIYNSEQAPYKAFAKFNGADHHSYITGGNSVQDGKDYSQFNPAADAITGAFLKRFINGDGSDQTKLSKVQQQFSSQISLQEQGNDAAQPADQSPASGSNNGPSGQAASSAGCAAATQGSGDCVSSYALPTITDPKGLANAIDQFIKQNNPASPLKDLGKFFVSGGTASGVNPLFGVAHALHESSLGTTGIARGIDGTPTYNAFGRTASASQPHKDSNNHSWYLFDSWEKSLDYGPGREDGGRDWFAYFKSQFIKDGKFSLTDVIPIYAPASDGNDEQAYIASMEDTAKKIVALAGPALNCSGAAGNYTPGDPRTLPPRVRNVDFGVSPNVAIGQGVAKQYGWDQGNEFQCLFELYMRESSWDEHNTNPQSGAYGIPQSLPADKMASAGPDWHDNPATQVKWGLDYIKDRYHTPCQAIIFHNDHNWY